MYQFKLLYVVNVNMKSRFALVSILVSIRLRLFNPSRYSTRRHFVPRQRILGLTQFDLTRPSKTQLYGAIRSPGEAQEYSINPFYVFSRVLPCEKTSLEFVVIFRFPLMMVERNDVSLTRDLVRKLLYKKQAKIFR